MIPNPQVASTAKKINKLQFNSEFTTMSTWDIFPLFTAIRNVPLTDHLLWKGGKCFHY